LKGWSWKGFNRQIVKPKTEHTIIPALAVIVKLIKKIHAITLTLVSFIFQYLFSHPHIFVIIFFLFSFSVQTDESVDNEVKIVRKLIFDTTPMYSSKGFLFPSLNGCQSANLGSKKDEFSDSESDVDEPFSADKTEHRRISLQANILLPRFDLSVVEDDTQNFEDVVSVGSAFVSVPEIDFAADITIKVVASTREGDSEISCESMGVHEKFQWQSKLSKFLLS